MRKYKRLITCAAAAVLLISLVCFGLHAYLQHPANTVEATFFVKPGGRDVVVMLDGRYIGTGFFGSVQPTGNMYDAFFPRGTHTLTISKPGYRTRSEKVTIKPTDGEWYGGYELQPAASPGKR